jgi:hypothetical protein
MFWPGAPSEALSTGKILRSSIAHHSQYVLYKTIKHKHNTWAWWCKPSPWAGGSQVQGQSELHGKTVVSENYHHQQQQKQTKRSDVKTEMNAF